MVNPVENSGAFFEWPLKGSYLVRQSHWKEEVTDVRVTDEDGQEQVEQRRGIIDTSLKDIGKGVCPIYHSGDRSVIRFKAVEIVIFSPAYLAGVIAFNLLKIIPTIVYLIGKIFYDYYQSSHTENVEPKSLKECAKENGWLMLTETGRSLKNVIRAPYYSLACTLSALYMVIDPYNGRKILNQFETSWNHNIDHKNFKFNHKDPKKRTSYSALCEVNVPGLKWVGENPYALTPCMYPIAYAKLVEGVWTSCTKEGEVCEDRKIKEVYDAPSCLIQCWDHKRRNLLQNLG